MSGIPLFHDSSLARFSFGPGHPFTGRRFGEFIELLEDSGLLGECRILDTRPATDEELLLVHSADYLGKIRHLLDTGGWLTLDTPVTPGAEQAQRAIAGSAVQAAGLLAAGECETAHTFGGFHHAGRDYGEGFCYYNDVALAAVWLLRNRGLERIMVLDTDAHQGNGTMDIFYGDDRVLLISVHQDPRTLYPGRGFVWETGTGKGEGYTVNIPMPRFSGERQYEMVFSQVIEPIAREFGPQVIIRNGGSDPLYADELTVLGMDLEGMRFLGERARAISRENRAPLLDMMVSGYGEFLVNGWLALFCGVEGLDADLRALSDGMPPFPENIRQESLDRMTRSMLESLAPHLEKHWSSISN